MCDVDYKTKSGIIRHQNLVHFDLPHKCNKCEKTFARKENLINHTITSHTDTEKLELFKCDECLYTSPIYHYIAKHKMRKHSKVTFACTYTGCKYSTSTKELLSRHIKGNHDKKTIKCSECGQLFNRQGGLSYHFKRVHPSQLSECDLCGVKFKAKESVRAHMLAKHLKLKQFPCPICKLNISNSIFSLNKHITAMHDQNSKYKCSKCQLSFGSKKGKLL